MLVRVKLSNTEVVLSCLKVAVFEYECTDVFLRIEVSQVISTTGAVF